MTPLVSTRPQSAVADQDGDITRLLCQWADNPTETLARLYLLVNSQLRNTARNCLRRERDDATVHTTLLVNETYLALLASRGLRFENRKQFFFLASHIMRRLLVERARRRLSLKRGGDCQTASLPEELAPPDDGHLALDDSVALSQALSRLEKLDSRQAMIVRLRYFAGLTESETAEALAVSPRTVQREWVSAKHWLAEALRR